MTGVQTCALPISLLVQGAGEVVDVLGNAAEQGIIILRYQGNFHRPVCLQPPYGVECVMSGSRISMKIILKRYTVCQISRAGRAYPPPRRHKSIVAML